MVGGKRETWENRGSSLHIPRSPSGDFLQFFVRIKQGFGGNGSERLGLKSFSRIYYLERARPKCRAHTREVADSGRIL